MEFQCAICHTDCMFKRRPNKNEGECFGAQCDGCKLYFCSNCSNFTTSEADALIKQNRTVFFFCRNCTEALRNLDQLSVKYEQFKMDMQQKDMYIQNFESDLEDMKKSLGQEIEMLQIENKMKVEHIKRQIRSSVSMFEEAQRSEQSYMEEIKNLELRNKALQREIDVYKKQTNEQVDIMVQTVLNNDSTSTQTNIEIKSNTTQTENQSYMVEEVEQLILDAKCGMIVELCEKDDKLEELKRMVSILEEKILRSENEMAEYINDTNQINGQLHGKLKELSMELTSKKEKADNRKTQTEDSNQETLELEGKSADIGELNAEIYRMLQINLTLEGQLLGYLNVIEEQTTKNKNTSSVTGNKKNENRDKKNSGKLINGDVTAKATRLQNMEEVEVVCQNKNNASDAVKKNVRCSSIRKNRIVVLTDDFGKYLWEYLDGLLGDLFSIQIISKPFSKVTDLVADADCHVKGLTSSDYVILVAGVNNQDLYDDVTTAHLEGEMITPGSTSARSNLGEPDFNTLDEPIKDTVLRDVKAIGTKFGHVLFPKEKKSLLKEWDLWGPLMLCTFMAMILQDTSRVDDHHDGGPEFAQFFVIVWVGSMIVTLNSKLLGGNISFFQSVCVLGYCLLPTTLALIVCKFILLAHQTHLLFFIRFTVVMVGFVWATYASMVFLGDSQKPGRKILAVYPIGLFYFIISWLVISHTTS